MTHEEFISEFQDLLQIETEIEETTPLADIPEWDSLAVMIIITWFSSKFDKLYNFDEIMEQKTCADLMRMAGI